MGFKRVYVLLRPAYGEEQTLEAGSVNKEGKEVGKSHAFLIHHWNVAIGDERQGGSGFIKDRNRKRPGEIQKMGLTEKFLWWKYPRRPRDIGTDIPYDDGMIKQAPGKWQPRFADKGASCQHLALCFPQWPVAGFSQDTVNDLQWENRETLDNPK